MNRRRFLALTTAAGALVAGCTERQDSTTPSRTVGTTSRRTDDARSDEATDGPSESNPTANDTPERIVVDNASGSDENPGTDEQPLATIQEGLNRAQPGDTVHVEAGEYRQTFETQRHGRADAPITITGPPDAVVKGADSDPNDRVGIIKHHYTHLTGLTLDGLWRPSKPDDPDSYRFILVHVAGEAGVTGDEYLRGVRVAPHAVGNAQGFVNLTMTTHAEVGPFKVIGLAGRSYTVGDANGHGGEIVYVGTPPPAFRNAMPIEGPDESHDIRVHHIDNSEGHPHSELVDIKQGAHDVTVEYCTDGGGGYVTDESTNASVSIAGHDCIVRWNDLRGGDVPSDAKLPTAGVKVDADVYADDLPACVPDDGPQECVGFGNAIYGNRIRGFDRTWRDWTGKAVFFEAYFNESLDRETPPNVYPKDQKAICGNEYTGETHADPDKPCPDWVPDGDGVGHTGGDSPWV